MSAKRVVLSFKAVEWQVHGEHGLSSEAIFNYLHFGKVARGDYPRDPDDFRRCQLLLRAVPSLRRKLPMMADLCPEWEALVARWDEIAASLENECPGVYGPHPRGTAQKTYNLMNEISTAAQSQ